MFAGPNGSGKSTLKSRLSPEMIGHYLNPDEIEQKIRQSGFLNLRDFSIAASSDRVLAFFTNSPFLIEAGLNSAARRLRFSNDHLDFADVPVNSYFASVASDFLQRCFLEQKRSFTIETVMSHASKVKLLAEAQKCGYRTYLYYIATDDPAINVARVHSRVRLGGHDVPVDRITSRYTRSLDLLLEAIRCTNRAYIFDNSGDNADRKHTWLAEITDGITLELKSSSVPEWFQRSILDKIER